jgi:hypothetical protein
MLLRDPLGRVRLGLLVGAFFIAGPSVGYGQVVPPPASEVPIPPKPKTDSTAPKPDTIKSRFARSIDPPTADVGPQYFWNREQLFGSGALTVADLIDRVPGTTSFRSGWLASPKFVAVNGDLDRVRVFYDGLELNNLDARTAPLLDLNTIQLWTLESVAIERLGGELRVHLRSWQADRRAPYTRTDISTGDEDTNIYRGFYGKRFGNGAGLQFAGQQYNTTSARFHGGGDALSFLVRVGTAGPKWSIDGFVNRTQSTRVVQPTFGQGLSLPGYSPTYGVAYLRGAVGNIGDGPWLEAIVSTMRLEENSKHVTPSSSASLKVISDTTDTTSSMHQYVLAAGFARGPLHLSATDRIRTAVGLTTHAINGRFDLNSRYGLVSVSAERDDFAKANRADAVARLTPVSFVAVAGALSRTTSTLEGVAKPPDVTSARIEAGVRLFGSWLSTGFITRDTTTLAPLRVFDSAYVATAVGRRSGSYLALRGTIVGDLGIDVVATRWAAADEYRPRYQARSEINLVTRWLSRFPSGNFGMRAAVVHEYRGETSFPVTSGVRTTDSFNIFSGLLEIRILRGVVSYQIRNLAGALYQVVPDFYMPRVINLYGIRWEFWN